MKILQVNCVYNKGSTGKIMADIHSELKRSSYESIICYGRGEKTADENVYKTCGELYSKVNNLASRFSGLMYGGCFFSTNKLIKIIKDEKPDVVHLHCINGYFVNIYRLVSWLKKNNIKTLLTLHAEFMYTANCGYALDCEKWLTGCGKCPRLKQETKSLLIDATHKSWVRMKKGFAGFEDLTVVSVSPWLMERAKQSPILADFKHVTILNGLDTSVFHPYDTAELKKKLELTNKKVIFHATPFFSADKDHFKGGYYVLKLAEMLKDQNVKIVVAGRFDENITVPENVILLGNIADQTMLAKYYSMADITVIASKKETFSMIVAESLCCGTPVVGFKAGGPETIAIPEYCEFSEYGDIETMGNAVSKILKNTLDKDVISRTAAEKYSKSIMAKSYVDAYKKVGVKNEK